MTHQRSDFAVADQPDSGLSGSDGQVTLTAFLQALRECSAVLSGVSKSAREHSEFKRDVATLFELHSTLVLKMSSLCATPNAIQAEIFKKKASVQVADIIGALGKMFQYDASLLSRSADEVIPYVVAKSDQVEILVDEIVSNDVVMNVKFSLLLSSLKFQSVLGQLPLYASRRIVMRWFNDFSAELARDLAFNWSKKASISDRHQLFQCALPICSDLVIEAWIGKAIDQLRSDGVPEVFTPFTTWINCPRLSATIENTNFIDSAGAAVDSTQAKLEIKPKLAALIYRYSLPDTHKVHNLGFLAGIASRIDAVASDGFSTSPFLAAGSHPITIDDFVDLIEVTAPSVQVFKSIGPLDLPAIERRAKSTLSYLWGLSNLVAKVD